MLIKVDSRIVETSFVRVVLRREMVPHIVKDRAHRRERYANRILPTLEEPDEVWMAYYDNGEFRLHYVKVWDDDRGSFCAVTQEKDEWLLYNFIPCRLRSLNRFRIGTLLYHAGE